MVSAVLPTCYGNALAKVDVVEGTAKRWHEPGCIPVEPIMVPRPGAQVAPLPNLVLMMANTDAPVLETCARWRSGEALRNSAVATCFHIWEVLG